MSKIKKYCACVLILFVLTALSSSELPHHHKSGIINDNNCSVCILLNSFQNSLSVSTYSAADLTPSYQDYTSLLIPQYNVMQFEDLTGRSPPPVSHI